MRALFSYGVAFLITLLAGAWLATGTLVMGGNGPGKGERPIISVIEGEEHGPIATQLAEAGVLAEHETEHAVDPHLTIAQRNELESGSATSLQSVRTSTFLAQPMAIEVPLRGRTRAKASVGAVAETAGVVDTVHVTKGQNVAVGDLLCTLDQGTRAAAVAQAKASLEQANASFAQAQSDFDTNAELRQKGLAAPNTARQLEVALSGAKAAISAAQAALDNAQAELDRTEIRAKVAGVVEDPLVTAGAMLAMGQPCATIVQLDPMVFIGQVP
jgi:multidrug efflux system membrane fusion protein